MLTPKPQLTDQSALSKQVMPQGLQPQSEVLSVTESDQELLSSFVVNRDRTAIERLIVRHAPMVGAVCRATCCCSADAQDAFQATFLVLVQSAHRIRHRSSLVAWLHGVAYRISTRIRSRRRREVAMMNSSHSIPFDQQSCPVESDPVAILARKVELEWLFRELQQLPEKLMSALVEYYLHGYSTSEISERQEISVSAVEGRLRRGRKILRTRLLRRGLSLSIALGALDMLKHQLSAADATHWCSIFQSNYLAELSLTQSGHSSSLVDSRIQWLVQGELSMLKKALLTKSVVGFLAFGCIGTLVAYGVVVGENSRVTGRPFGSALTFRENSNAVESPSTVSMPSVVLGQITFDQDSTKTIDPGASSPVHGLPNSQTTSGGPTSTIPKALSAFHNLPTENEPMQWTQPEGEPPAWLRADESIAAIEARVEENRKKLRASIVNLEITEMPLSDAIKNLSELCRMNFLLDVAELEIQGVDRDSLVTIRLAECSLREALDVMLQPLELSYRLRESGVEITSQASTEHQGTLRCYDLSYMCSSSEYAMTLMAAIQNAIEPASWISAGGESSISIVGSMLIVVCPDRCHFEIESLLRMMYKMNPSNAAPLHQSQIKPPVGPGPGGKGPQGVF